MTTMKCARCGKSAPIFFPMRIAEADSELDSKGKQQIAIKIQMWCLNCKSGAENKRKVT